jgi:hypothetical protein
VSDSKLIERLEALRDEWRREASAASTMGPYASFDLKNRIAIQLDALVVRAREGEKPPVRLSPLAAMDMKYDTHKDIPPASAGTEGPGEVRAYSILEGYGVSKERARSVANGIMVLATRYEREIRALEHRREDEETLLNSLEARDVQEGIVTLTCPTKVWEDWQVGAGKAALREGEKQ